MNTQTLVDRIFHDACSEDPDSAVKEIIAKWRQHEFILKVNDEWQLEGFIMWFKYWQELACAVDPSLPKHLTPQCFDPIGIAKLFGFAVEEFTEFLPDVDGHVVEEVSRLSRALEKAMPVIEAASVLDPEQLSNSPRLLYAATDDAEALSAKMLCRQAGLRHSGYTRGLISQLVKDGFLRKVPGGYVRAPSGHLP